MKLRRDKGGNHEKTVSICAFCVNEDATAVLRFAEEQKCFRSSDVYCYFVFVHNEGLHPDRLDQKLGEPGYECGTMGRMGR